MRPTLINMVREPVERLISNFYYLRSHKRWTGKKDVPPVSWFTKNFEKCVLTNDPECQVVDICQNTILGTITLSRYCVKRKDKTQKLRKLLNLKFIFPQLILLFSLFQILSDSVELQLTYFCGGWRECGNISSPSSLQLAKYSVETGYSVVGVVERFNTSVNLLEAVLPEWFRGAAGLVTEDKRNRNSHPGVREAVREVLEDRLENEIDFYRFVNQRLSRQEEQYLV